MGILSRDQILSANDSNLTRVDVPEWGGEVCIRALRLADILALKDTESDEQAAIQLLTLSLSDEEGNPILTAQDVETLANKNGRVIERLASLAAKVNGLTSEAIEETKGN